MLFLAFAIPAIVLVTFILLLKGEGWRGLLIALAIAAIVIIPGIFI